MDLVSSTLDKYLKHRFNGTIKIEPTTDTKPCEDEISAPTIHRITFTKNRPCCISIRNDLKYLAAGFENSSIFVWTFADDVKFDDSQKTLRLLGHTGPVYGINFLNNEDLMLSCSEDTTIRLWCLKTKCNLTVYRGHNYPIWAVTISSQTSFFASGSMDTTARVWQFDKITPSRILCGHDEDVECLQFHPNEKYIATGSSDKTVRLWSISDGKMVRLMVGHSDSITSLSFLPDGKFLASASRDGAIKIWNLATNCTTTELNVSCSKTLSFSPEQKFIASCGIDKALHLWQVDDKVLIEKERIELGSSMIFIQSQFHQPNKLFIIAYQDRLSNESNK